MEANGFVKFIEDDTKGAMHYVTYQNKLYSLTNDDSKKLSHIKNKGTLRMTVGLQSTDYREIPVVIDEDLTVIKAVFDYMKEISHTHYKSEYEGNILALEYIEGL